ncbi:ion transporter [Marinobacter sp.]|uniref:ion transporter n=1 Tax=Marinobacter sp. TaxID=50741 RepID=UPI003A901602
MPSLEPAQLGLRTRLFKLLFESESRAAKAFDIGLVLLIFISVGIVMLDSIDSYHQRYGDLFFYTEWGITILFTIELALRIYCLQKPWLYLKSFYGIIDLLAILPSWLTLIVPGSHTLIIVRMLRALRLFRVLDMMILEGEKRLLLDAMIRSRHQILLFLFTVLMVVTIFSSILYLIEPAEAGFTNIPTAIYWGIVTLTTVGYGDITPVTPLGQFISVAIMLTGYSIIALPVGVFSAEVIRALREERYSRESCPGCGRDRHERDARYCKFCGTWLDEDTIDPRKKAESPAT